MISLLLKWVVARILIYRKNSSSLCSIYRLSYNYGRVATKEKLVEKKLEMGASNGRVPDVDHIIFNLHWHYFLWGN